MGGYDMWVNLAPWCSIVNSAVKSLVFCNAFFGPTVQVIIGLLCEYERWALVSTAWDAIADPLLTDQELPALARERGVVGGVVAWLIQSHPRSPHLNPCLDCV